MSEENNKETSGKEHSDKAKELTDIIRNNNTECGMLGCTRKGSQLVNVFTKRGKEETVTICDTCFINIGEAHAAYAKVVDEEEAAEYEANAEYMRRQLIQTIDKAVIDCVRGMTTYQKVNLERAFIRNEIKRR